MTSLGKPALKSHFSISNPCQSAAEGLLKGVASKGEFHEIAQSASEALLTGVAPTGEIHLENQCASEGIVEGVRL